MNSADCIHPMCDVILRFCVDYWNLKCRNREGFLPAPKDRQTYRLSWRRSSAFDARRQFRELAGWRLTREIEVRRHMYNVMGFTISSAFQFDLDISRGRSIVLWTSYSKPKKNCQFYLFHVIIFSESRQTHRGRTSSI